jgi:hypothetical protein
MATKKVKKDVGQMAGDLVDESPADKKVRSDGTKRKKQDTYKGLQEVDFAEGERGKLLTQVKAEYDFATRELKTWVDINLKRLKLYNNQKRNEEHIGEPLLFTHMNTWLASLYDDTFDREWVAREEGDIETAENLTAVSEYDHELMNKDELDYNAIWDSLFFSYAVIDMLEFDPDLMCPAPNLIDPLTFYYDTFSSSVDGNVVNKKGMRFLGWDMYMSKAEILTSPMLGEEVLNQLDDTADTGMSHKDEARKERLEAQGGTYSHLKRDDMQDNNVYELVQWRTIFKGKKVVLVLNAKRSKILGARYLPQDDKGQSLSWFVVAKKFNPQPHQFKGMSLPDLLEDKQRHKAMMINDQINLARSLTYGSYVYDMTKIKNKLDLKWGYDKWIGVDGDPNTAIAPVRKDSSSLAFLDNTLSYIDVSAQKASATPELQQGVMSEQQRTLGELNLIASSSKTRYSLALKTLTIGDRDFWMLWYLLYKINFKEGLGDKVARIGGSTRVFREFNRENLICSTDPDVSIKSQAVEEARNQGKLKQFAELMELIMQDPEADKRASIKKALELAGLDGQEIDNILPPTSDEIIAQEQNDMINKGEEPPFLVNDNHLVHIRIHREAMENDIKKNHILTHLKALKIEQENPTLDQDILEQGMQEGERAKVPQQSMPQREGMQQEQMTPSQEASLINKVI